MAKENNVPLLSQIPIESDTFSGTGKDLPVVHTSRDSITAKVFLELAETLSNQLSVKHWLKIMISFGRKKISNLKIVRNKKNWKDIDFIIWIVPFVLVHLSCFLIASTQRNLGIADWYQHAIIAYLGSLIVYFLAQVPLLKRHIGEPKVQTLCSKAQLDS